MKKDIRMDEIKNKRILIVDDEYELLNMIKEMLLNEGFFNILGALNCKEALKAAQNQNIALCVLDVNLPDGDGFSLYERLREFTKAPVIFLISFSLSTTAAGSWTWGGRLYCKAVSRPGTHT